MLHFAEARHAACFLTLKMPYDYASSPLAPLRELCHYAITMLPLFITPPFAEFTIRRYYAIFCRRFAARRRDTLLSCAL